LAAITAGVVPKTIISKPIVDKIALLIMKRPLCPVIFYQRMSLGSVAKFISR